MLIPHDVVVEILSRLPAKSLIRLRWACKYLFDLISRDPSFVKKHLHHSTARNEFFNIISLSALSISKERNDHRKIFQCYFNYNNTTRVGDVSREVSITSPFDCPFGVEDVSRGVSITSPFDCPFRCHPRIKGSSNGLILLLYNDDNLCIWNLCTKEYRILPHPLNVDRVVANNRYKSSMEDTYGFGYDHTTDDYKVIRSRYCRIGSDGQSWSDVQVYTLGTNSWRRIRPNPYELASYLPKQGVCLNGVLYWIDCSDRPVVISFDFGTEMFHHVWTIPRRIGREYGCLFPRIQVFERSLCVVIMIKDRLSYEEIWVMNDNVGNNNEESEWYKAFAIPNLYYIEPIRFIRNGEILMLSNQRDLVLYDFKSNNCTILCRNICKKDTHYVMEVYTESLVSLNSGTYKR